MKIGGDYFTQITLFVDKREKVKDCLMEDVKKENQRCHERTRKNEG